MPDATQVTYDKLLSAHRSASRRGITPRSEHLRGWRDALLSLYAELVDKDQEEVYQDLQDTLQAEYEASQ